MVGCDHEHLLQVIGNLISNAIKFSPPGKQIIVSHEIRGPHIHVSVMDQGNGIPKDFQPRVFEMFARAETGIARATPGTGIGLSVCKGIIDYCGGIIAFETEEGKGTNFYFELPIIKV